MTSEDAHYSAYGGKGPLILGVLWTEVTIALILVVLRLHVGLFTRKTLRWDFFWAAVTLVIGIAGVSLVSVGVTYGMGNHLALLSPHDRSQAAFFTVISISFVLMGYTFGKLAVIAFLLQIQNKTHRRIAWFLLFLGCSNAAVNTIQCVLNMLQCTPARKFWEHVPGNCDRAHYVVSFGYLQGVWSALSDLTLVICPLVVFWNLQMKKRLKVGLCLLLSSGVFSCICACVKTATIAVVERTEDRTEALTPLILWAWTEYWVVLIAGSLPPLWPLFVRIMHLMSQRSVRARRDGDSDNETYEGRPSRLLPHMSPLGQHQHWLQSSTSSGDDQHQHQQRQEVEMDADQVSVNHKVSAQQEARRPLKDGSMTWPGAQDLEQGPAAPIHSKDFAPTS